jgi:hypothetical protein
MGVECCGRGKILASLAALRANGAEARARLERALPELHATATLRDLQHALAREHGFPGWAALKEAVVSNAATGVRTLALYETKADALLEAYRTGTPEALGADSEVRRVYLGENFNLAFETRRSKVEAEK